MAKEMKRVVKDKNLRLKFTKNLAGDRAIFIDLFGDSHACVATTAEEAIALSDFLTEAAHQVERWSLMLPN